ncbi:hypothetical protein AB832_01515 [Flavobacteriaceae bacterium (ex Bugula neritina AB1)]|nr:hypothetical protein AB832_01515 [Flavobacteriaceae bacterium (ex Bugula neritina AB1)]
MNITATYISELLYRYECVIVPGFGAFLTKRQPASIQESTQAFFPPQKLISFNSQLQNNDGLLANYIAQAEHISYTDAVAKIQRYVLSLQNKINQGKHVVLDGIGSFYSSTENTLQFEPSQDINYLTEAFGLSSFISPSILREKQEIPKVHSQVNRETYKKQVETLEETTPITFTPEKRRERPYMKYAAIAVVALGIGGFVAVSKINRDNKAYNDNLIVEATNQAENKIQQATFEISSPLPAINLTTIRAEKTEPIIDESSSLSPKYHVVAGAYRIKTNAKKKVQKLNAQGFNATLIGVNKFGLHQVVYNSYTDRNEALLALSTIKKQQDSNAWLLIKEL